jgi:hypothetical protein
VTGALAVAGNGAGFTIAATRAAECHGVEIVSLGSASTDASSVRKLGCAPADDLSGVTIGQQGGSLWLWAGTSTRVSADGGATWR